MSKFFDDTRKAQDWSGKGGVLQETNVQGVLTAVQKPDALVRELAHSRLGDCRRISLSRQHHTPVVYPGNDACQAALESYRTLRTRLTRAQAKDGLRSAVLTSAVPGEGKTLTALNLGLCSAQLQDMRVLVIDADLRTRGLTRLLGSPAGPGLAEILSGQKTFAEAILATDLSNFYVLPAGSSSVPPPELFAGERWKEFIGWCAEIFRLVLVDSPPLGPLADTELLMGACDAVMVVTKAFKTPRERLKKVISQIDAKKLLGVVLNGTETHSGYRYSHYYADSVRS